MIIIKLLERLVKVERTKEEQDKIDSRKKAKPPVKMLFVSTELREINGVQHVVKHTYKNPERQQRKQTRKQNG